MGEIQEHLQRNSTKDHRPKKEIKAGVNKRSEVETRGRKQNIEKLEI